MLESATISWDMVTCWHMPRRKNHRPTLSYASGDLDGGDLVVSSPVGIEISSASSATHYKTCDRPDLVPEGMPVRMGNKDMHHTHSIRAYEGLVHCNKCYNRVMHGPQIRELARVCNGKPTNAGLMLKRSFENDA